SSWLLLHPRFRGEGWATQRCKTFKWAWNSIGSLSKNARGWAQPNRQRADDFSRDLVLEGEDVSEIAVISACPDVRAGQGIDQLDRDADSLVDLPHTALDHVAHPQLPSHLGDAYRTALVDEGRVARDDRQSVNLREVRDQVLGQSVGEVLLLGIGAQVV